MAATITPYLWGTNMKDFLTTLLKSLNSIEVKGKENIDILLGCMMAVEQMISQLEAPAENDKEANDG